MPPRISPAATAAPVPLQELRPAGGRYPFGVDDVLEADRDAVQWPLGPAGHDRPLRGARLGQCPLLGHMDESVQFAVERVHTGQAGPRQFDR